MHRHDYGKWSDHRHVFFAHVRGEGWYDIDTGRRHLAEHRPRLLDRLADFIWAAKEWAKEWRW